MYMVYDLTYEETTTYTACKFTLSAIRTMDVAVYDTLVFPSMGCKVI